MIYLHVLSIISGSMICATLAHHILVQAGVELLKVAAHLGHKNIQSTLRYAHLSPKVTEETGSIVAARIYGEN